LRRFLVTTVRRFWHWYRDHQPGLSFYELIPQDRPARLYFDLEFYRASNPGVIEEVLINDFNACVSEDMLVLEASTETKFSEHVIVHLHGGYLFPSNIAMKPFIAELEKKMFSSGRCLVWNADATKLVTLCDTAVYSL
uniref:DNA-directed primase/polymerase protein n=1 Tax=Gongylonema pulchrum TaxID=637853 RepID=A0A183DCK8_9BILA